MSTFDPFSGYRDAMKALATVNQSGITELTKSFQATVDFASVAESLSAQMGSIGELAELASNSGAISNIAQTVNVGRLSTFPAITKLAPDRLLLSSAALEALSNPRLFDFSRELSNAIVNQPKFSDVVAAALERVGANVLGFSDQLDAWAASWSEMMLDWNAVVDRQMAPIMSMVIDRIVALPPNILDILDFETPTLRLGVFVSDLVDAYLESFPAFMTQFAANIQLDLTEFELEDFVRTLRESPRQPSRELQTVEKVMLVALILLLMVAMQEISPLAAIALLGSLVTLLTYMEQQGR